MTDSRDAFERIVDTIERHKRDGYDVDAVRIDEDTATQIRMSESFIEVDPDDADLDIADEAFGLAAGVELIPDPTISAPVANNVELIGNAHQSELDRLLEDKHGHIANHEKAIGLRDDE